MLKPTTSKSPRLPASLTPSRKLLAWSSWSHRRARRKPSRLPDLAHRVARDLARFIGGQRGQLLVKGLGRDRPIIAKLAQRPQESGDVDHAGGAGQPPHLVELGFDGYARWRIVDVDIDDILGPQRANVGQTADGGVP